jgi:hypothetical protein
MGLVAVSTGSGAKKWGIRDPVPFSAPAAMVPRPAPALKIHASPGGAISMGSTGSSAQAGDFLVDSCPTSWPMPLGSPFK